MIDNSSLCDPNMARTFEIVVAQRGRGFGDVTLICDAKIHEWLKEMKDHLERLKAQGIEAID